MNRSSGKWRGFFSHFGIYLIIITALAIINFLADPSAIWFVFPALGWGVAVAIHFFSLSLASLKNVTGRWHGFLAHFGIYAIVITMLAGINFFSDSGNWWFLWPALGWGVAVAIQLWVTLLGSSRRTDREQALQAETETVIDDEQSEPRPATVPRPLNRISSQTIQAHLDKAHAYKAQIEEMARLTNNSNSRMRLQDLINQVDEWVDAIEELAQRVDQFQRNRLIHQDLESVPQLIAELKDRLAQETNPDTQLELKRLLDNRENQLTSLERLQHMMKRAELQIESTLSSLGTIYSQLLTSQSTDHVADYGRLSTDVDEEVRVLQDQLDALEEVKLGRG